MEETTASPGGALGRLRRIVIVAVILVLTGATVLLLAERNSRFYFLSSEGDLLVVARGVNLPWGKRAWEPEDQALAEAYAAIELPAGVAGITEQRFGERQDLDRALFELLAGWADARIRTDEPAKMREGLVYVNRASMLPGISSDQSRRLRALRAELAYYEGKDRLERGGRLLDEAKEQLMLATEASPARAREAVAILDELAPVVERLARALQTSRGLRGPGVMAAPPEDPAVAEPAADEVPAGGVPAGTTPAPPAAEVKAADELPVAREGVVPVQRDLQPEESAARDEPAPSLP